MMPLNFKFKSVLYAQVLWLSCAIGYNLISIWRLQNGMDSLIGKNPEYALVSLSIFAVAISLGFVGIKKGYLVMLCLLTPCLMYIGVYRHINAIAVDSSLEQYANYNAWIWAIGINVFGSSAFILALIKGKDWVKESNGF